MKTISARQEQGVPGVYGLLVLDVVSRWGYNADTLFAPFQLNSEMLADPECRIPTPIANELVKHALKLTGESDARLSSYANAHLNSWLYWLRHYDCA